jgi:hypothetical protein
MTPEQQAAYIQAQANAALIEAMGMMSENLQRLQRNESIAYPETAFQDVILRAGIHHNGVIGFYGNYY